MLILGIETSCDETGVAILEESADGAPRLLAHRLHSQVEMHRDYGGVVPELASRDHIRRLLPLIDETLEAGGRRLAQVDTIAVTRGPGLAGALLVGAAVAHGLGFALGRPVVGVHHLEGHLLSPLLATPAPPFPFLALLASGGHTQLLHVEAAGAYTLLGETLDDAAGEAFDKAGQLLGVGYPGGPAVSRLADFGTPGAFRFPRPLIGGDSLDFSFSGLKTAVLTAVRAATNLCEQVRADIALAFVDAVVDVLATKAMRALDRSGTRRLVVAGGVSANKQLRTRLAADISKRRGELFFPPLELCTDNGAMIALAGWSQLRRGEAPEPGPAGFSVRPRWPLSAGRDSPRASETEKS
ncbi:MAG TPA: tRNA (adenosine(37)-N6)-threonylcarbamoyltransferase complex transferase subunit TsaD [Burkholderiaceae bacterium]|nr:tRNA (adenosine(37)-N6)-threonylcarbamoyltransferase complex transferase subunit TsaD [Burkholderiaceae bacterium]